MKKVTLVASMVMACVVVQASQVVWGTSDTVDSAYAGGTAYLLANTVTSEVLSYDGDLATADSFSSSKFKDKVLDSVTVGSDGSVSKSSSLTPASTGLSAGMNPLYMVIISSDGKSMIAMPSTANANIATSAMNVPFKRTASAFSDSYTAAIPEPCSVALIALGLAALGLKRKVA